MIHVRYDGQVQKRNSSKEAREAAESANRVKTEFIANMSHELRTPLNAVPGFCQILNKDGSLSQKHKQSVDIIRRSGEHPLSLINDVSDFSRIEAGIIETHPRTIHLNQFIKDITAMVRFKAMQKNIVLSEVISVDLPGRIHVDDKLLGQVLMNLLGNAVKYTENGQITLQIQKRDLKIRFSVQDTGIGIHPEKQKELFIPFRRLHDPRTYQEGTGLGLALSQRMVQMMGGKLESESSPGVGSVFRFDIDLIEGTKEEETVSDFEKNVIAYHSDQEGRSVYQILIVEDNPYNRYILKNMLSPIGFVAMEAADGYKAVKMLKMDGFDAGRQIRSIPEFKDVPIIAVSANTTSQAKADCQKVGIDDFV